ncbi:amidase [Rhizoctonia solani AG-1 IB]|uniref:Amidase n=1 Tax=Thanatephorus cucumeris (strain AG1-IB / isolate 7/3/14) TaxID=1108050 RepID=M5C314_THACB|nr:amidase [Rhizoctonia solani AG-1 IB]
MNTHTSVNVEFGKALDRIRKLGGVIVDPADFPSAEEMSYKQEEVIAMVQFKIGLNAHIKDLVSVPTGVSSFADIIAFNNANKDLEQPEGLIFAESTTGYNSTYHQVLSQNQNLARDRGIDAVLKLHKLDALLLPANLHTALPAAMAGYPTVTVPLGFHPNDTKPFPETQAPHQVLYPAPGMPFGLSFIGTAYTEPSLIGFAYAYEQYTRTRLKRRAYKEAVPTIQFDDIIGKSERGSVDF